MTCPGRVSVLVCKDSKLNGCVGSLIPTSFMVLWHIPMVSDPPSSHRMVMDQNKCPIRQLRVGCEHRSATVCAPAYLVLKLYVTPVTHQPCTATSDLMQV